MSLPFRSRHPAKCHDAPNFVDSFSFYLVHSGLIDSENPAAIFQGVSLKVLCEPIPQFNDRSLSSREICPYVGPPRGDRFTFLNAVEFVPAVNDAPHETGWNLMYVSHVSLRG